MANNTAPLVIAHRGFSGKYPENTFVAFQKAMEAGADGFECDLRLTRDDKIVVFHDDDLRRLCGTPYTIEERRWSELQHLKVKGQEPICSLEDLIENFSSVRMNLEIKKSINAKALLRKLIPLIEEREFAHPVLISSFSWELLELAKDLRKNEVKILLGFIFKDPSDFSIEAVIQTPWLYSLHPFFQNIDKLPTRNRKPLYTWTPNTAEAWKKCLDSQQPITAMISDHPDRLRTFLGEKYA